MKNYTFFFFSNHVRTTKTCELEREDDLSRPKCEQDVMLGLNPSCHALERLSPFTLLFVGSFFALSMSGMLSLE